MEILILTNVSDTYETMMFGDKSQGKWISNLVHHSQKGKITSAFLVKDMVGSIC